MGASAPKADFKVGLWVLEAVAWLAAVQFVLFGVVLPLVGLARADEPPADALLGGWFLSDSGRRLQFELTPEGIEQVLGKGVRLPESGDVTLGDITFTPAVTAEVTFAHPGWADLLATAGSSVIGGLTGAAVALLVLRLVRSIRRGSPFNGANVRRLYAAGIITMWGGVADLAVSGVGPLAASASPSLDGLVYPSTLLQFGFVGVGTVFIVVADVFRRGLILQRETEGLV